MHRSKSAPYWHTDVKGVILIFNYISQISHGVFLPSPALRTRLPQADLRHAQMCRGGTGGLGGIVVVETGGGGTL